MSEKKLNFSADYRRPGLVCILLVFLIAPACAEKGAFTPPPPPQVTVSHPLKQTITDYLEFTGNTQAINTVQLRARVEGYLEKVLFRDGDPIKKGQLLFLIQQNTYRAKLQQAEAAIISQKANLVHAQKELVRYSNLLKQKAASQTTVDQWQYERDSARGALLSARAQRELAALDLSYTRVRAPFNGRVDRRLVDPGNLVGSGTSTILAEVNQIDPIYIYFTINERDLLHLMGGTKLSPAAASKMKWPVYFGLANEKGYPHKGRLDFAAISVTSTTGTLLLRGIAANPKGMVLPGLYARVRVPVGEKKNALLIPIAALGFDQQGPYVLVVNAKKVVERRGVKLGPEADGFRVIEEGLQGGEWVVVEGGIKAIPGRPVQPEQKKLKPLPVKPKPKPKMAVKKKGRG